MEYKLYLSGMGFRKEIKALHKDNVEKDLNLLKKFLEKKSLKEIDLLNLNTINDNIDFFNLLGSLLIIKNELDQTVLEIDLYKEFMDNDKLNYDLYRYKENNTTIEIEDIVFIDNVYIGSFNSTILNKKDLDLTNVISYNGTPVIKKIIFKLESFEIQLKNNILIEQNVYIRKYNREAALLLDFKENESINLYLDLLINKYSENKEYKFIQNKIIFSSKIKIEKFLSLNDNVKNYISNKLDIYFKEKVEEVLGLNVKVMKMNIEGQKINLLSERDIHNLNLKTKEQKDFLEYFIEIEFFDKIELNKAIFLNKISSILLDFDTLILFVKEKELIQGLVFEYGFCVNLFDQYYVTQSLNLDLSNGL